MISVNLKYNYLRMLTQLACNATNSAAINKEGGVFVWGKGGFGLLGDEKHSEKAKSNP